MITKNDSHYLFFDDEGDALVFDIKRKHISSFI